MRNSSQLNQAIAVLIGIAAAVAFLIGLYLSYKRTKESYNEMLYQPVVLNQSYMVESTLPVDAII